MRKKRGRKGGWRVEERRKAHNHSTELAKKLSLEGAKTCLETFSLFQGGFRFTIYKQWKENCRSEQQIDVGEHVERRKEDVLAERHESSQ
jgi:hypothetical protein